uniref:Predicted protein n=1 Tax=Hordeum vulgare subsp. vulgare TaxID=112509 RepID=F2DCW1_HORVV|nr:predicted protein [Hordeum vulgare subsp. vulgare]
MLLSKWQKYPRVNHWGHFDHFGKEGNVIDLQPERVLSSSHLHLPTPTESAPRHFGHAVLAATLPPPPCSGSQRL